MFMDVSGRPGRWLGTRQGVWLGKRGRGMVWNEAGLDRLGASDYIMFRVTTVLSTWDYI